MRRMLSVSTVVALVVGGVGLGTGTASAATTHVVWPGHSIQAAVDRAHPGDTILIKPGHYRQSVLVTKDGITIRGSGAGLGGTVIEPAQKPRGLCAKNHSGICVASFRKNHQVANVTIRDLYVRNFGGDGVIAFRTRNLLVQNIAAVNNGEYGIFRLASTGGAIITNVTHGSGEAGIYIGDSRHANVQVLGNISFDNDIGIFFRHSRHAFFAYNKVRDNCVGLLALSAPSNYPTGAAAVVYNTFRHNNKHCAASDEGPATQGTGILLVGATDMFVGQNAVLNNRGRNPLAGGIVLFDGKIVGAGPTTHNLIRGNTLYGNSPAGIVDHSGGHNTFKRNHCNKSIPAGHCHG